MRLFRISMFMVLACTAGVIHAQPRLNKPQAPAAAPAAANDTAIRVALEKAMPGTQIDSIKASPIPGFREVAVGGRIIYVSADGRYLFQGSLFDLTTRTSMTEASQAQIRRGILAKVGPERRIIFAAAKPVHRVTVFTDIDCGYCRKMHQQIAEYNKLGISVEYLFYPRAGVGSDSSDKAINVWCSADRRKALTDAKNDRPVPKKTCANPIAADYALGQKIGFDGTPAVYSADGTQVGGYLAPQQMLATLDKLAKKPAN
ncbi:MAG TPA: DsbC family protein [Arenimonas sp.]|nr:DsbC family protein [Arenimonas sp.]HOZ05890.1 DsbC family protein [Arenimonas sp.]HPO24914.1 DsbC family protein [Arenimonas sp.]HPW31464.1 DsbC family protein [Arenimonas sp.]